MTFRVLRKSNLCLLFTYSDSKSSKNFDISQYLHSDEYVILCISV